MNKDFKITFINIFLLIFIFLVCDIFCFYKNLSYNSRDYLFENPKIFIKSYFKVYKRMFYNEACYKKAFLQGKERDVFYRPAINPDSGKPPILILGCSLAYGFNLTQEQSFGGKLAKITGRPIYNRAICARGADEMLFQLQSDEFYLTVPKPEWIIYVFFHDQIRRTQIPCSLADTGIFYDKNLKLKHDINFPIFYTFKNKFKYVDDKQSVMHFCRIIKSIKEEAQKHWGNDIKFAFVLFDSERTYTPEIKSFVEDNGFVYYSVSELTNKDLTSVEYKIEDKVHPSEAAWDILTPIIAQKSGL